MPTFRKRLWLCLGLCFGLCLAITLLASSQAFAKAKDLKIEGYTEGKYEKCAGCHQSDPVKEFFRTRHADAENPDTPESLEECESCHGPSAAHANFPLQIRTFEFGPNSPNTKVEQNQACLRCHTEIDTKDQVRAMHKKDELTCASCHTIHRENDPLLDHTKSALICIDCHDDKRPQQHITGLHLIEVGRVTCVDCHSPHAKTQIASCTHCHKQDEKTFAQESPKAQRFHRKAVKNNLLCIECHSGVSHGVPSWVDDLQKQQQETDF